MSTHLLLRRVVPAVLVACLGLAVQAEGAAAQDDCWQCDDEPFSHCVGGLEIGWSWCTQPCFVQWPCGPDTYLSPNGSVLSPSAPVIDGIDGSAAMLASASSEDPGWTVRSCDGAIIAREYDAQRRAEIARRSRVLTI